MRTNIVLNDELVREAMRYSNAPSKRALIEEALETFVRVREEQRKRESYRDRLASVTEKTRDLRLRQSPSSVLRDDRNRG